jgi:Transcriptional regulator, AbiEi antitoxin, Type IV TA system
MDAFAPSPGNPMRQVRPPHHAILDRLIADLQALPDVRVEAARGLGSEGSEDSEDLEAVESRAHARLMLQAAGRPVTVLVELKKAVYPRDARGLVWRVREARGRRLQEGAEDTVHAMIVAEEISPGAKELLAAERVGYYDGGGSLYLPASGAYLFVQKPAPKSQSRAMRSLFTGRRAQVLHAMLLHDKDWFGVKDLAQRTGVLPSTISPVLAELERQDWVHTRGQGPSKQRQLTDPAALLDAWAKDASSRTTADPRRYFVPAAGSGSVLERLDRAFNTADATYALSFEAAAQRYAPFLSSVSQLRIRTLEASATTAALTALGARPVGEGANLVVLAANSAGELQFRERVDGAWLASPIQVYLDLLGAEGRAKEMAEHLRKARIGF